MNDHDTQYPEDAIAPAPQEYVPEIGLSRYRDGDLLTKRELARALGCSPRTLQRLVQRFQIPPPVRIGNRAVWVAGEVRKWIAAMVEQKRQAAAKEAERLNAYLN